MTVENSVWSSYSGRLCIWKSYIGFLCTCKTIKEESLHYLGLRSLLYVFSAPAVSNSILSHLFSQRGVSITKRAKCNPLPWLACYKAEVKCWKMKAWTEAVTHPIQATSVAYSSAVTHTGVQKRDKSIRSEKEINRSESRQSWSGVCQFNGFVSVCVTMRDLQHGLWYVATYWMYVSRWWAGTCWVLDGLFINHEACGISLFITLTGIIKH